MGEERKYEKGKSYDLLYRPTDHGLRVWDVEAGTEVPAFKGGLVAGIHAAFTPDGKNMIWRNEQDWREGFGIVHMRPLAGGLEQTWDNKDKTKWVSPFAYPDDGHGPPAGKEGAYFLDWHFTICDGNKEREIVRYKLDQVNVVPQSTSIRSVSRPIAALSPALGITKVSSFGSRRRAPGERSCLATVITAWISPATAKH